MKDFVKNYSSLIICLTLAAGTLLIYGQVAGFEFTNYDDDEYVAANPFVLQGLTLRGTAWAFVTGYTGNWIPLTWLSHMLGCEFFGRNAGAHHLINAALHLFNAVLLFLVLKLMTRAVWRSAVVAGLFAWHPLHVESVAWVAERKDVLSMFFGLLAIWAYAKYVHGKRQWEKEGSLQTGVRDIPSETKNQSPELSAISHLPFSTFYTLAIAFFALSLMSKSMLVTLPFVLLLLDFWPLRRLQPGTQYLQLKNLRPLIWEKLPWFTLSVVISIIALLTHRQTGAMPTLVKLPITERLANAAISCIRYLENTAWPDGLAVLYPYAGHWPAWRVAGALFLLVLCSLFVLARIRRSPWLAMGWCWFLGTLVPVIGVVQVGPQAMADRYMYLPSIGLFVAIVWGAAEALAVWGKGQISSEMGMRPGRVRVAWTVSIIVLTGCLAKSWMQTRYWQNSVTLFKHAIAVTSGNVTAHYNYAQAQQARGQIQEAIEHYNEALRLDPNYFAAHVNLGTLMCRMGDLKAATNHLTSAVLLRPRIGIARYSLGQALTELRDWPAAEAEYAKAASLNPRNASIHNDWGKALLAQNKFQEAIEQFEQALRLDPGSAQPYAKMGMALAAQHKAAEAAAYYRAALRLEPDLLEVLNNLAWLLATENEAGVRDGVEAVRCAQRACELTQYKQALMVGTLAAAYAETQRFDEARHMSQKAIALAEGSGQAELAIRNRQLLQVYEAGQAYRQP